MQQPSSSENASATKQVYQFKISLRNIHPGIWRKIQVPSEYTFEKFSDALLMAMGWRNYHCHQFTLQNGTRIGSLSNDDDNIDQMWMSMGMREKNLVDESTALIEDYFVNPGEKALLEYDFGDCWEHVVRFDSVLDAEKGVTYPRCISGRRACPPEDVGGVDSYSEFLQSLKDPKHKEHKEHVEWLERCHYAPFDPEKFVVANAFKNWNMSGGELQDMSNEMDLMKNISNDMGGKDIAEQNKASTSGCKKTKKGVKNSTSTKK